MSDSMKKRPSIKLIDDPPAQGSPVFGRVTLHADLPVFAKTLHLSVDLPDRRAALSDLVPLAFEICDKIVSAAVSHAASQGKTLSCHKGCDACCSCLPGMSEPEALRLLEDIQRLPQVPRNRILQGFAEMGQMLEDSGLHEIIQTRYGGKVGTAEDAEIIRQWWSRVHRSCPILQDNACSMYSSRPTVCREFLAVSDPNLCSSGQAETVKLPLNMYHILGKLPQALKKIDDSSAKIILFPSLLRWYAANRSRAQRTWRAPVMVERFLSILCESASGPLH